MSEVRIAKPKLLTIILICAALYLVWITWEARDLKAAKWISCEELTNKDRPPISLSDELEFLEWYNGAQYYPECLDNHFHLVMLYHIHQFLAALFIGLAIISWKVDALQRN